MKIFSPILLGVMQKNKLMIFGLIALLVTVVPLLATTSLAKADDDDEDYEIEKVHIPKKIAGYEVVLVQTPKGFSMYSRFFD